MSHEIHSRHERLLVELSDYFVHFGGRPSKDIMNVVDYRPTSISFVDAFYKLGKGSFPKDQSGSFTPPPQGPFAARFFELNQEQGTETFTEKYRAGWEYRSKVAWPSLVRDVQFFFLVQEYVNKGVFDSAVYSPDTDIQKGVDCEVTYEGVDYYVNLYVDSEKSRKFLEQKKNTRGHDKSNPHVHLTVDRFDDRNTTLSTQGQDLWLYSTEHIECLIEKFEAQ